MGRDARPGGSRKVTQDWGGYWSEAKLDVLRKYLSAFNVASKSAEATVYLDLFAGRLTNTRPDTGATYPGSTAVALEAQPPFTKLVFWELEPNASRLRTAIEAAYLGDRRWQVVPGDCNEKLEEGLRFAEEYRWAPAFAFIDPKGLDVAWATLERLSRWRKGKTKVEMWILLPEPAMERVLGLDGGSSSMPAERLTTLYGSEDWQPIHERRRAGEYTPEQARAEYVNLLRWRLQHELLPADSPPSPGQCEWRARLHDDLRYRSPRRRPDHAGCLHPCSSAGDTGAARSGARTSSKAARRGSWPIRSLRHLAPSRTASVRAHRTVGAIE